jgi:hypothetical protein
MLWSSLLNSRVIFRRPMRALHDTTVGTPVGDGVNALKLLLQPRNKRATIVVTSVSSPKSVESSSVRVVGPPA